MRHGKKFNHLGRKTAHRKALLSNMACSLIEHKRIKTTLAKAKALRKYVEPIITKSKTDTTHSRRVVFSYLNNKEAVKELFGEVRDKVMDRPGGYTRILKIGTRLGDNAEMALIELVDFNEIALESAPSSGRKKSRRSRRKGKSKGKPREVAPAVAEELIEEAEVLEQEVDQIGEGAEASSEEVVETVEEAVEEVIEETVEETVEEAPVIEEAVEEEAEAAPIVEEVEEEAPIVETAPEEGVEEVVEEEPVAEAEEVVAEAPVVEEVTEVVEETVTDSVEEVVEESPAPEEVVEEVVEPTEAPVEEVAETPASEEVLADDLTKIEGIGPKIKELLIEAGIPTFAALAASTPEQVKEILTNAGSRFARHNPGTWPDQAKLAAEGKWEELKKWQDELDGGKE